MQERFVAAVIVSASLLVIGAAALLDFLDSRGTPSAELCATQWNRSTNGDDRAMAAEQQFEFAVVSGNLAKDRFPGCGVLFRHGDGRPWLLFGGWLHTGRVDRWDLVTGERWGFDSPEGGPETPNAMVTVDGCVRLIEV
jgi:hypothetical protein